LQKNSNIKSNDANKKKWIQKHTTFHKFYQKFYYQLCKRHFYAITGPFRALPDFIIIGSMKSGTTSLYYNICEHPCVIPAAYDELGFFDRNYNLGINWYRSLFPTNLYKNYVKRHQGIVLTGEDTPFYFWSSIAAERISKLLPNIKLLVIVRNPIDRAYSEYQDVVQANTNTLPFDELIKSEMEKLRSQEIKITNENYQMFNEKHSYLLKGLYAKQLQIWAELFRLKQIFVISTEDLAKNPTQTMNQVFKFLNLPDYSLKNLQKRKVKKYSNMTMNIRKILIEYYKPFNEQLYKIIDKKFDWDK